MWKFASAHFDHLFIDPFNTTTLSEFCFWMNPASSIFHNCYLFIVWSIMCWHSSQNKLFSPSKITSFLARLMTWAVFKANLPCGLINCSHYSWPTNPTESMDPNIWQCILEPLWIIISRHTRIPCFCIARYHCNKYFSGSSPITGI